MTINDLLGAPYPQRKQLINDLLQSKNQSVYEYPLKFQNQIRPFKVFRVPLGMPKYRLTNGRTQAYQQVYLAQNPTLPANYFETDLEVITKHLIQHNILKKMVEKDLIGYFEKETQDRPLIIDNDGFVINGNRRLCAMRELFLKDSNEYARFSHVDVLILPPCTEKDKDELEAELQIKKDIKQDYDWVSEGFMYRKRMEEHGYTLDNLVELYGKKKTDIITRINMLNYAEEYLISINKEKQYDIVIDAEYAFEAIVAGRKKHSGMSEAYKNILKDLDYLVLHDSQNDNNLGFGRVYNTINKMSEYFKNLIENLQEELKGELADENRCAEQQFMDYFGSNVNDENKIIALSRAISKKENKEKILNVIKDTIERQEVLKREKENSRAAFNMIQKAHSYLADALSIFDNNTDTMGIIEQLEQIKRLADEIREKVEYEANY